MSCDNKEKWDEAQEDHLKNEKLQAELKDLKVDRNYLKKDSNIQMILLARTLLVGAPIKDTKRFNPETRLMEFKTVNSELMIVTI